MVIGGHIPEHQHFHDPINGRSIRHQSSFYSTNSRHSDYSHGSNTHIVGKQLSRKGSKTSTGSRTSHIYEASQYIEHGNVPERNTGNSNSLRSKHSQQSIQSHYAHMNGHEILPSTAEGTEIVVIPDERMGVVSV